jgi:GalNAc-alpha-(1->4)-GalNAc-alpha-(1->3)-diNAcBac-PP-undecaprenol alpha-1,4-N-acetyl-D-galactosaminyltransferase
LNSDRVHPDDLVLVISDLSGGGAQRVLTTLANHWVSSNCQISVITFSGPDHDHFQLDHRINRIVIGGQLPSHQLLRAAITNFRRLLALRRAIQACGATTVVSFLAETNILVILATVGLEAKTVISERNDPAFQLLQKHWEFLRRRIYRFASVVTVNSRGALETLAAYVPREKLVLVPNPPPQIPEVTSIHPKSNPLVILNIGRLHEQKAQAVLLRAFSRLETDCQLVIVGVGERLASLQSLAQELNISGRVIFAGRQTNLDPYYRGAAIFALPSLYEGTPNALLEAMAHGIAPVVSDNSGGALDYVTNGQNGLVVQTGNVRELSRALETLLKDSGLRQRIGAAARERIVQESYDDVISTWETAVNGDLAARTIHSRSHDHQT